MALTYGKGMEPGTSAPPFSLPDFEGRPWSLDDFDGAAALVVIFTCNHCPYAKAYEERLVAVQRDYADRGVKLVAINPNVATHPADGVKDMRARAAERGFNFPYLADESQQVARAYDAACTPDVYLFDRDRKLVCQTRIDDDWQNPDQVSQRYLRDALDAVLAGEPLPFDPIMPLGCSIKWK